jgi:hypothetical protein
MGCRKNSKYDASQDIDQTTKDTTEFDWAASSIVKSCSWSQYDTPGDGGRWRRGITGGKETRSKTVMEILSE